jgi:transposase-like protein
MRQHGKQQAPQNAEETVRDIRRATRRQFSAEEKIRIVLEGLRGEDSIAELCRKEGIAQNLYYRWSKEFLEAGKKRLAGDTACNCRAFRRERSFCGDEFEDENDKRSVAAIHRMLETGRRERSARRCTQKIPCRLQERIEGKSIDERI